MMNTEKVTNITIICRSKKIRLSQATKEQLLQYVHISVGTDITGTRNGRKVRFELLENGRFGWIEAK